MRTGRSLTVCCSVSSRGGGLPGLGGVLLGPGGGSSPWSGGGLLGPGGVLLGPGGVSLVPGGGRFSLVRGGSPENLLTE